MIVWISKLVLLVVEREVMANFGVRGRISWKSHVGKESQKGLAKH